MENSARKVPTLTKLGKLANAKKFDDLEDVWPTAVAHPEYEAGDLVRIAGQVERQGDPHRAEGLLEVLLDYETETRGVAEGLAAAQLAAKQFPRNEGLRKRLKQLYADAHAGDSELPGLLDCLFAADRDLPAAVELADAYLNLRPGAFAADLTILVPGRVEKVLPDNGVVTVEFDERRAEYGPETIGKLHPLPADHFGALVIYDPQRLRDLAAEDAVAFVDLALRGEKDGRISYRDLKNRVTRLLGEKGWRDWWQAAREKLRRAPRIAMGGGSQPLLRRLRHEDRYEDRLRRAFDHETDPVKRLKQVLDYLAETKAAELTPEETTLLVHLGNSAGKIAVASLREEKPAVALAALAVHAAVASSGAPVARPNPRAAEQVLARLGDAGALAQHLPEGLQLPTLEYLTQALPDRWAAVWAEVALRAGKRVCDAVVRRLLEEDRTAELQSALDRARERPTASPELIGWLWRILQGSPLSGRLLALEGVTNEDVFFEMLDLVDSLGKLASVSGDERHVKTLEGARGALLCHGGRPVRELVEGADRDLAGRLKATLTRNTGLTPAVRTQLLSLLRGQHPELFVEIERPWEEEDVIYTTENGLHRRQNELDHILKEEIPEVAREIGEAASFGDLSENAEFTAALEKRDQLTSRATRIENELAQAKIITPDMVEGSYVTIGTRVQAQDLATGGEETYTFLGPWDADSERRILNYKAPLALAFMGARPGAEVEYGDAEHRRRWRVAAIEAAV